MSATILIVSNKHHTSRLSLNRSELAQLKIYYADNIDDAGRLIATTQINMIFIVIDEFKYEIFSFFRQIMQQYQATKVTLFSCHEELSATLSAMKTLPPEQIIRLLSSKTTEVRQSIGNLKNLPDLPVNLFNYKGFIGSSPEFKKLRQLLAKIAPTGTTVLLQGESGTGKEVIARAIHFNSSRNNEVFIPVDCAAINESIMESELFGHAKGAFTGADRTTLGMIRSAHKGTLFLDEIGELPMTMQVKLLRTLQERAVKPVGDTRVYPVDIRIIAATNSNLTESVKKGTFRQDLYYRLNAITIYAPPLREHRLDIPLLCEYFLKKLSNEGYPEKVFSETAIKALCAFDWPGNIRELENVIRAAVTLSPGNIIEIECLLSINSALADQMTDTNEVQVASIAFHEKNAIRKALNQTDGNRRAAAELLGISEATLYRRLKAYSP